jgi:hypothetical protein
MNESIHTVGTLVQITSYGPFFGCKGTIRALDFLGEADGVPSVFYLVTLHDEPRKELWLEHDAVVAVSGEVIPSHVSR